VELYTHDDYLQNFAETGLVGLAAFLAFWAFIVAGAWSLARAGARTADARRLELGLGLLGLAVAFGVNALTNFPWRVLATQQLSWLALAILAAELARLPGSREAVAATAGTVMDTAGSAGTSGKTGRDGSRPYRTLPGWAWAMVSVLCFVGALYGARWFFATLLFKQGNLRKDQSQAELQVQGLPYYEAAARAGLSPTMQVEAYLYLGSLYNLAGRPDLAETWFKRGIGRYPDFLEAWYNLGYTYQRRYEADHDLAALKQAVDCYRKVLALNPRASAAATNLGNLLYQQGAYAEAGALYDNLLSFAPDSPEARYNLAAVSIRLNDRKKAVVQLDLLLAKHPDFAPAVTLRKQLGR
jgi:tetratricopeptide (TPR) repeat protein